MGIIGIIANPASGKDVRRLVARASVFDNQQKQAIVGRALTGILAAAQGNCRIAYLDDQHGIVRGALEEAGRNLEAVPVAGAGTSSALDTVRAAACFESLGCRVVLTLGGDGNNRAVAVGWPMAPLIPISTGTNNVFPVLMEGTVAGAAAGLIGSGRIELDQVAAQAKLIRVQIDGEADDLALIDAVLSSERFVGAKALLAPEHLRAALLTRANPAGVGITALGGLLQPVDGAEDCGLHLTLSSDGQALNAPLAPGYYCRVGISGCRRIPLGEVIRLEGPGVLAFDGERERVLMPGQRVHLSIERAGPRVVDVLRVMHLAARHGWFHLPAKRQDHETFNNGI